MSHLLSDEDSTDSDSGIRFKTETTRKPQNDVTFRTNQRLTNRKNDERSYDSHRSSHSYHSRQRERSTDRKYSRHRRSRSKEHHRKRSKSREKIRFNRSRSRSKEDRHKRCKSSEKERYKRSKSKEKTIRYNTDYKNDDRKHIKNNKIKNDSTNKESILLVKETSSIYSSNSDSEVNKSELTSSEIKANQKTDTLQPSKYSENQNYGPKLPPNNGNNIINPSESNICKQKTTKEEIIYKTTLPSKPNSDNELYGPALPSSSSQISTDSESDSESTFGPSLPPNLTKNVKKDLSESTNNTFGSSLLFTSQTNTDSENESTFGPSLPPHLSKNVKKDLSESSNNTFGPSLPPNLRPKIMGPSLPPHLLEKLKNDLEEPNLEEHKHESEGSDDDMIGPLPEGHSSSNISHKLLEERALELRINALNPVDNTPKREEWMTALPDVHRVNLGLGPRQFRSKEGPDLSDRSSWTDTPEEKEKKTKKEKKVDIKEKSKLEHIAKRDKEQEEIVKRHKKKKKRDKALIELHQEKLAKKKKEESMPQERRPFDRDVDLKVNRFDEAQKKAILKKAQLLDTRFSTGESKFL